MAQTCYVGRQDNEGCDFVRPVQKRNVWKQVRIVANSMKKKGYGILLRDSFGGRDGIEIQKNLSAFVQSEQGRGIERYLSYQHDEERRHAKDNASKAVLDTQRTLKGSGKCSSEIWLSLAHTSRIHSMQGSIFARRLGIADELAASGGADETLDPSRLVNQMHQCNARRSVRRPSVEDLDEFSLSDSDSESDISFHMIPNPQFACFRKTADTNTAESVSNFRIKMSSSKDKEDLGQQQCPAKQLPIARTA